MSVAGDIVPARAASVDEQLAPAAPATPQALHDRAHLILGHGLLTVFGSLAGYSNTSCPLRCWLARADREPLAADLLQRDGAGGKQHQVVAAQDDLDSGARQVQAERAPGFRRE
jgi:hypothetical protein